MTVQNHLSPDQEHWLHTWKAARLTAFRSLDAPTIRDYAAAYAIQMPASEPAFWATVHKARTALLDLSDEERETSRAWLRERGLTPLG
jgi:hypothetical protein